MIAGIWEEFLSIVRQETSASVVETWFKAVSLHHWDPVEQIVYLHVPNAFVRDWLKTNYHTLIALHMGRLLHVANPRIVFVDEKLSPVVQAVSVHDPKEIAEVVPAKRCVGTELSKPLLHHAPSYVNKSYSFSTFIVGPSNSLAYAAAHAVTEKPGVLYNPLFIYGGSGLGKTHLMHSIGNAIREKHKKLVVLYQTTDRFVNEFINAIRFDKVHKFQAKYKDVDVLLIDDVQFISNKEQTQEAFFHIFNALYEEHKQIVFSSDTVPQNISGIAERLRSRLSWGLVADIYVPSLETKIAILKKKAECFQEEIDDEVFHFIAARMISNVRDLEGALIRVLAFASLTKQRVTLDIAKRVLSHTIAQKEEPTSADFDRVIACVNKYYSYSLADLRSKNRNKDLSIARQVAMFLMKKATNKSLREIGDYLGGRDHSTVLHAITKVEFLCDKQIDFQEQIYKMEKEILV